MKIYKGSNTPYHLKSKGVSKGTYIRVGSSNRLADQDLIQELERLKNNISFDGLAVFSKNLEDLNITSFKEQFERATAETLDEITLTKLNLLKVEQGHTFPTNALLLLSDDPVKDLLFPYAKIECARFKGTTPGNFIDQKSISGPLGFQAEQAYQFVLRHISQGATYHGVYRKDRWEYPVIAIREVIRNAVIHRDYSLRGKDIKIAIFDNKIEISSPGKLLPTVDFDEMEAGQSDIRNKVLAPVFKKLGIIEQWGNGLRLIAEALKNYADINLLWSEPGLNFRVSFLKKSTAAYYQFDLPANTSEKEVRETNMDYTKKRTITEPSTDDYGRLRTITDDYEQLRKEKKDILLFLLEHQKITRREAAQLTGFKKTKTHEILTALVKKKLIRKKGGGRSTYYVLGGE